MIGWRKRQTKKSFQAANVIPPHIHSDPAFDEKAFTDGQVKEVNYPDLHSLYCCWRVFEGVKNVPA